MQSLHHLLGLITLKEYMQYESDQVSSKKHL